MSLEWTVADNVDVAAANANAKTLTVFMGSGSGGIASTTSYNLAENDEGIPLAVDLGDLACDLDITE